MPEQPQLHASIVAMISLAAGIAAKHPKMGLCQLERLRQLGITEPQIESAIEIAHHIRDEAALLFDEAFDQTAYPAGSAPTDNDLPTPPINTRHEIEIDTQSDGNTCDCSTTPSSLVCC